MARGQKEGRKRNQRMGCRIGGRYGLGAIALVGLVVFALVQVSSAELIIVAPPAANLDQVRNGPAGSPVDPGNWVNGNAGPSNSHYVEGMSVPYRVVMTTMPIATPVTLTLGYDIKNSDHHAIDYLTQYDRLEPHVATFGHPAETIDPLIGVSGVSATVTTFPFPVPDTTNSPVPGQPATSFNALSPAKRVMTLYGGTITSITYTLNGDLTASQSETQITIVFQLDSDTAVLAWGGHIASRNDWGFDAGIPRSAGGISGSPYHMRLISWDLNNLGNQDRSLSAGAVVDPCQGVVCPGPTGPCDGGQACNSSTGLCEDLPDPVGGTSCDADANLCTIDECDGAGSCVNVSSVSCPGPSGPCDGGTTCDPATGGCVAVADPPSGTACDADSNLCTLDECDGIGNCLNVSNVVCPPAGSCETIACNTATGSCESTPLPTSTSCEADGDLCTIDHCDGAGTCVQTGSVSCPGPSGSCDGGTSCDPGTGGCVAVADPPSGTSCDADANLCTLDECDGLGNCVYSSDVVCPPAGSCETISCTPATGSCDSTPLPSSTSCEADGDLCTIDHCDGSGTCVQTGSVSCQPAVPPCEGGQLCNPSTGSCEDQPDASAGTTCERDGDLCTLDECNGSGSCVTTGNVTCSGSANPCDAGEQCDPGTGTCVPLTDPPTGTPCEADGNLCTIDQCNGAGGCDYVGDVSCPPSTQCMDITCDPLTGDCVSTPKAQGTSCEADGDLCTIDQCDGGGNCVHQNDVSCPDPGACNTTACDPGTGSCTITPEPASTSCEADGDLCTIDECDGAGSCVNVGDVACQPADQCDGGSTCNPSTGACVPNPDPDSNTVCEADGDLCTIDHCDGTGNCVPVGNVMCPDPGPCATTACDPGTGTCPVTPKPAATTCEADGDLCTIDQCDGTGNCVNVGDVPCQAASQCDGGSTCNPSTGACVPNPDPDSSTVCEADGNLCTHDHCDGQGACVFGSAVVCQSPAPPCEGGQVCNTGTGLCEDLPDAASGTTCELDSNLCTLDACNGTGTCIQAGKVDCSDLADQCNDAMCLPDTGQCDVTPKANGTDCERDGNPCTIDQCDGQGGCTQVDEVMCPGPVPPCDAGQACNTVNGQCVDLPDPDSNTTCDLDSNLCTVDRCDGNGACVFVSDVQCQDAVPPCEGGQTCNTQTGLCEDDPDAPAGTVCEADGSNCTVDQCDGAGNCVMETQLCGACCDGTDGSCVDGVFPEACNDGGDQLSFSLGHTCDEISCAQHRGACCDLNDPLGNSCVDNVLSDDCTGSDHQWWKGSSCAEVSCVVQIPTVSEWGMVVLALLLLTGAKVYFGFRREWKAA